MKDSLQLVVGADGQIGGALFAYLKQARVPVIGTVRDSGRAGPEHLNLDLRQDLRHWRPPCPVEVAYFCFGVTKLQDCSKDPLGSARINVQATLDLARILAAQGTFVIFLSSNQVFDGSRPREKADSPFSPVNEYGRQKAQAEKGLREFEDQVAFLRLTKVLGPETIFSDWAASLAAGKSVEAFSDLSICPFPIKGVVSILRLVADRKEGGIWQVSGEKDLSYLEAARIGARILGADPGLIKPTSRVKTGLGPETGGFYTSLNTDRLTKDLGLSLPPVDDVVRDAFLWMK
ncbi:MAG: sugar nucleotide-binding protein [Deltaproteobacteria bacterium]|nr:sugar nucleotide-binding protein [Deltaproteobacteria bacterium]